MTNPKLQKLTDELAAKVAAATEALQGARSTVQEWRLAMETLLTRYHLAAAMLGLGKDTLTKAELKIVTRTLESQLSYLAEFAKEIEASGEWNPAWNARAQMYVQAVGASWWHGNTHLLPLPSVPKDGTCQCLSNCNCHWEIIELEGDSNYDCHWRLGGTKHCQTCEVRAETWNPLQVRGGILQ